MAIRQAEIRTERPLTIRVKYHDAKLPEIKAAHESEWIDLCSAEDCDVPCLGLKMISLGISLELPDGYEAIVAPRSSTFKHFGIICANGIGIIDNAYKGDNDIWHFPAIGMRFVYGLNGEMIPQYSYIRKGDRICQFRIQKCQPEIDLRKVDFLGNDDRNGLGSTGKR